MTNEPRSSDETGAEVLRGIALIVAAGLALGIGFNTLQRSAGSGRGLAWIKEEQKLASLESMQTDDSVAPPVEAGVDGAPPDQESATTPTAAADNPGGAPGHPGTGTPTAGTPRASDRGESASSSAEARAASDRPSAAAEPPPTATPRETPKPPNAGAPSSIPPPAPATAPARAQTPAPRTELPSIPDTRQPLEVQYATAKQFYDARAATFVDARSREEYEQGHIPGALHLDFDEVFANPVLAEKLDSQGKPIIAYCGSSDCDLSKNLAYALIEGGHRKVLVFTGGTADWTAQGQPLVPGRTPAGSTP